MLNSSPTRPCQKHSDLPKCASVYQDIVKRFTHPERSGGGEKFEPSKTNIVSHVNAESVGVKVG